MTDPDLPIDAASVRTIGHYEAHAEAYRNGTLDHDVSQNIAALLEHISGQPPFDILDFGCGPGRDLRTFASLGHRVTGLDGSPSFVAMARAYSGCEVLQQNFVALNLPANHFDGIFANAVLFHVPSEALPKVLRALHASLKKGAVLFCSNPRGQNQEGWYGDRYASYFDLTRWRSFMSAAKFQEITHYYRPAGLPREQQPWLASVWRKL